MIWYDADKLWPGMNVYNILIDGHKWFTLKPEYKYKEHNSFAFRVKFYILCDEPQHYDSDLDISLEKALFYNIDCFCCNTDAAISQHRSFLISINCNHLNFKDFITEDKLTAPWSSIDRWMELKD